MKEKMLKILEDFDFEKLDDFLENEVKNEFISSCEGNKFQGWHHDICLDINGNLSISGQLSCGSMSMDLYEGNEVCLYKMASWFENDFELQDSDLDVLDDEEKSKLLKALNEDECCEKVLDLDYEVNYKEKENIFDFDLLSIEEKFRDLFEDKYNEIVRDSYELQWYEYKENIIDRAYEIRDEIIQSYSNIY